MITQGPERERTGPRWEPALSQIAAVRPRLLLVPDRPLELGRNAVEPAGLLRTGSENAGSECRNDESASLGRDCSTGDDEGIPFAHSGKEHLNDNTAAVN